MKKLVILFALLLIPATDYAAANPGITYLGPYGGDVRTLAVHPEMPDRIFLGTADGQIFVSTDRGESWTRSAGLERRKLVLDCIVFHPQNPDVIYAGGWELKRDRGELYKSLDGGKSWNQLSLGRGFNSSVRTVAVSPVDPDLIAAGITEGVMLSKDGGDSWERISRGYRSMHNVHSLAFDPVDRETLFVGTFRLGWKTDNLGKKWTALKNGIYWDSDFFSIQINPQNRDNVIIGACSGFYRSTNKGEKWNKIKNGLTAAAKRTRVVLFDPSDPGTVYAGTTAGLYKSMDNGQSWKPVLKNTIINSIIAHPSDSNHLLIGTDDAGVMVSRDGGDTFKPSNKGFSHRQVSALARKQTGSSSSLYIALTMDREYGGFFHSADNGKTWEQYNEGLGKSSPWITSIVTSDSSERVILGTRDGIYTGIPGKSAWESLHSSSRLEINQIAYADHSETRLLLAAREGLFSLDLSADKITKIKTGIYKDAVSSVITVNGKSYAGTKMGVFSSTDQGKTWTIDVEGLPYVAVNSFTSNGSYLYCTTEEGIYRLNLNGSSWESGSLSHDQALTTMSAGNPESLFSADMTNGYFFFSPDKGDSWDSYDLDLLISHISCLFAESKNHVLAGTISEGLVRIEVTAGE